MSKIRVGLFVSIMLIALAVKSPILLLIAIVIGLGSLFLEGAIAIESKPKKKALGSPKIVKIDGVGEVQWITDPSQLETQRIWSARELKRMEDQLLDRSTDEWRKEGEKVVLDELEAADKPDPATPTLKQKQRDRTVVAPRDFEYVVRADEKEEPIAYIVNQEGRYPLTRPYAGGGVITLADRRRPNPDTDIL